jgi:hypothetical protein
MEVIELVPATINNETIFLTPYELGFHSYCVLQIKRIDNPFEFGTIELHAWDQGWWDALQEQALDDGSCDTGWGWL